MTVSKSIDFFTFGGGLSRYRRAARRLQREAAVSGWFRHSHDWSPRDLEPKFMLKHSSVMKPTVKGFGFWIWKSFLIGQELRQSTADFICFLDAGCTLNSGSPSAERRFIDYVEFANEHHIMTMAMPHLPEQCWTKADVLDLLSLSPLDRASGQRQGGILVIKNSEPARELIAFWHLLSTQDGYRYVDDSPSVEPCHPCFVAHRHDQSILSCLTKSAQLPTIEQDESFHASNQWESGQHYPFWAPRHLSGSKFRPHGPTLLQRLEKIEGALERRFARFQNASSTKRARNE